MKLKIAVIVKTDVADNSAYTTHKNKVTFHSENLFLSSSDKSSLEYGLRLTEANNGQIDAYSFEKGILADRCLHEALALGAKQATKFTGLDVNDPLQANEMATEFVEYLKRQHKKYDLILTGDTKNMIDISALIAQKLNYNYYDNIMKVETSFDFEAEFDKGKVNGKFNLPAVISLSSAVNTPRLPNFFSLETALDTPIEEINLKNAAKEHSEIKANQDKNQKVLFDLNNDKQAVEKLISVLQENGVLK
ncbi:hypothetical protein PT285_10895 [Lactobacillus sp. ESL0791]|uniref:hypothetical protein n=1 Tax=Lactobacillus sp. ESL0791 TaxID=2983234 RepID=UPI0023F8812D|nr:hypothetical protein [Lactobacillus sp. ESL0791]MDF7639907.1 hypothetical protein [Lactobacillus sp. ESL0791]